MNGPASVLDPRLDALIDTVAERQRADFGHMVSDVKPDGSLITACDRWSDAELVRGLAELFPGEGVLSEEGRQQVPAGEAYWVVDPLDGTFNYSRGTPLCCSSIGLWDRGEPVLGAVYNFYTDELFTGIVGQGAWLNGRPIRVSGVTAVAKASLGTGFPHHQDFGDAPLRGFIRQVQDFKKIRMLGSAALMGVYAACGWLDVYVEDDVWLWDIAGAAAVCRAAGGVVQVRPGKAGRWAREVVCAASPELLAVLEARKP